jgi:hypothetical protein
MSRFFSRRRQHLSNFSRFLPTRARPYDFWCRSSYMIDTKNEYFLSRLFKMTDIKN